MAVCIGIRREDKSIWERRTPLIPDHVREIEKEGIEVLVQPSEIRIFTESEYQAAGAQVSEDLSKCCAVFAVKEMPSTFFWEGGTYVFFSHTIKGQTYNMPMLMRMMELGCNLIDYEKVVDDKNRRLIFFGWHAGVSGMVESLVAYGRRLQSEGLLTPFSAIKQPHEYNTIGEIKSALEVAGRWIQAEGLPDGILPVTVGVAGYGNVARGAQEMLDMLPVTTVSPGELKNITAATEGAKNTIFKAVFKEEDMVVPKSQKDGFELQDYYDHPEKYSGIFENYLPHLSMLINCIYWDERYPRLVSKEYLQNRWQGTRLAVIGDISCDINGSIEVTRKVTEPGNPTFVYDPASDTIIDGWAGNGPVIMAVDILPSELPTDASIYFSKVLKQFIPAVAKADYSVEFKDLALPEPIKRAMILHRGRLTPEYEYISKFLD
jgi:saccharopine dehydrogenase (NAD+, L-lysine-forming)